MMSQFRHAVETGCTHSIARGWLAGVCAAIVILSALPGALAAVSGVDQISDTPMFARIQPPPANIMFLLDDSGSMNFEILVKGYFDGSFPNPDKTEAELANDPHGFCYVFDDVGDNTYKSSSQPSWYAGQKGRLLWKNQYYQINVMYYNPNITYLPWPSYSTTTFLNADPDKPRSHPLHSSPTLDLQGTSFTIGTLSVPHSHYFIDSAVKGAPYLVVIDKTSSKMNYYRATVTGTGLTEKVSGLTLDNAPPADVVTGRTYSAERQNFANWFTYHRRREFEAKNALANVIKNLADVRVGIYSINQKIVTALLPVNVTQAGLITDSTPLLLGKLYSYQSEGGTPLKQGLDTVGKFFASNSGTIGTESGPLPYDQNVPGAACQQSFTVILTDGFYSDYTYVFGHGNADGDNGEPYADSLSNTLADIAMYYYETDLNALPDQVPTSKYDKAKTQHMATYAVAFGVSGNLIPENYDESFHDRAGHLVHWPTSIGDRAPETIDDLWHATANGRGKFYYAADPQALTSSLNDLMNAISEILIGSSSSVTVNGDYLYGKLGSNTLIYQGLYSNRDGEWTGDVKAYPVDAVTGDVLTDKPKWSAAEQLQNKAWDQRVIATFDGSTGVPFLEGNLSDSQKTALGADLPNKVKYLRGGAITGPTAYTYRYRSQKLGDIVNSAPVFSDDVIYAGGNDGMLHAFDAGTGTEIFAYVPNLVFGNLELLTPPDYTHRFYVDLTPTIKKGTGILTSGTDTLLVGGLRKGGKGYFGLNVTNAKSITSEAELASRVLWEFPKTSDPYMGYSFSKPVIVKSNDTSCPWVVIFGNGFNSDNGTSALYIIDAKTGEFIKRIDAGAGPGNGLSTPIAVDATYDGLVDFVYAGDLKGNLWKFDLTSPHYTDWGVAFTKNSAVQPLFQAQGPGGTVQPITTRPDVMLHPQKQGFIVCFGTGKYLGESDYDTSVQSVYGIWDYGDKLYDLLTQKWSTDDNTEFLGTFLRDSATKLSNQPQTVSLLEQTQQISQGYRFLSSSNPTWLPQEDNQSGQEPDPSAAAPNHAGYYFDLQPGERVISDVIIRNKLLLAVGFTPNDDRCGSGGNSMFMEINAFTGGSTGGSLFDITGDLKVDSQDLVDVTLNGTSQRLAPSGLQFIGNIQPPAILRLPGSDSLEKKYLGSSTGKIEQLQEIGAKLGVAYWMEIHY